MDWSLDLGMLSSSGYDMPAKTDQDILIDLEWQRCVDA
jgi:hypothetical protein